MLPRVSGTQIVNVHSHSRPFRSPLAMRPMQSVDVLSQARIQGQQRAFEEVASLPLDSNQCLGLLTAVPCSLIALLQPRPLLLIERLTRTDNLECMFLGNDANGLLLPDELAQPVFQARVVQPLPERCTVFLIVARVRHPRPLPDKGLTVVALAAQARTSATLRYSERHPLRYSPRRPMRAAHTGAMILLVGHLVTWPPVGHLGLDVASPRSFAAQLPCPRLVPGHRRRPDRRCRSTGRDTSP
jgi:hypothetical protein